MTNTDTHSTTGTEPTEDERTDAAQSRLNKAMTTITASAGPQPSLVGQLENSSAVKLLLAKGIIAHCELLETMATHAEEIATDVLRQQLMVGVREVKPEDLH